MELKHPASLEVQDLHQSRLIRVARIVCSLEQTAVSATLECLKADQVCKTKTSTSWTGCGPR
jgi:hypothetical protein